MSKVTFSESDVIQYLSDDYGFFVRNPLLLEKLQVQKNNGKLASLSSHQINLLKERNSQLKSKLSDMIHIASENERILSQIFEVALKVGQYSKLANVIKCFCHYVNKHFSPDWIRILLPEDPKLNDIENVVQIRNYESFHSVFSEFISSNEAICGRLRKEKLSYIFDDLSEEIGSSILLPVGEHAEKGLLIFASRDESRFHPDMSTDLLMRLAEILESKLKSTLAKPISSQALE